MRPAVLLLAPCLLALAAPPAAATSCVLLEDPAGGVQCVLHCPVHNARELARYVLTGEPPRFCA